MLLHPELDLLQGPDICHRSLVTDTAAVEIEAKREQSDHSVNQNVPVHTVRRRARALGEERQDKDNDEEDDSRDVDCKTVTSQAELGWKHGRTRPPSPDHAANGADVAGEERGRRQ